MGLKRKGEDDSKISPPWQIYIIYFVLLTTSLPSIYKMSSEQNLPERPAAAAPAEEGAEGGEKLSKKALKKLEKEREKVDLAF
jgi:hypothetical protein